MNKLLWNAAEIRGELYEIWNTLREEKNEHLAVFARQAIFPHPEHCRVCHMLDGKIHGINRAIRHFGGRVQIGRMP